VLSPVARQALLVGETGERDLSRVAVVPLLNDPVMVPSEPILKLCKVPLAVPSCSMDAVLFAAASWVITGVVPLSTFQLKVWLLAPSANPEMLAVISVGGVAAAPVPCVSEIRFPFPSNVNVPVCRIPVCGVDTGGVPETVGLRSADGMESW